MKTRRILLALASIAMLTSAVQAVPNPLRLFEIPVTRFTIDNGGDRWSLRGTLDSFGVFRQTSVTAVPSTITLPAEALDRNLIHEDAWLAYQRLGTEAVANFDANDDIFTIPVGGRFYAPITVRDDAKFDLGDLFNISARSVITPGGEPLIGGLIIEHQSRRVLIRGVGPTLAGLGVTTPLADPYIAIYKHGSNTPYYFNDDWNERFDAAEIKQISEQLGTFPLPDGSKDAAYLVELEPGAYTVHLTTFGSTGGTALLEIYSVP